MPAMMKFQRGRFALLAISFGFRVFPLSPNKKTPAKPNWQTLATTDPEKIYEWWNERDYNIGIACGQGLIVFDYDDKPGQYGLLTLLKHEILGLSHTRRVKTPHGIHSYYRTTRDLRNSQGKVGLNTDTRGAGGYVVGEGSTVDGHDYVIELDMDPQPLPLELEELAIRAGSKLAQNGNGKGVLLIEPDLKESIARATHYLQHEAPEAIQGSHGDFTTYCVAAKCKDFGVSEGTTVDLLYDHWNFTKAFPPWTFEDLEKKVTNAYQYTQTPLGSANALVEFGVVPGKAVEIVTPGNKSRLYWVQAAPHRKQSLIYQGDPLIRGVLNRGALSVLYGQSGSAKTFVALGMGFAIATGQPWNGHKTSPGLVVYVAAEGGAGMAKRIDALMSDYETRHGAPIDPPFYTIPCQVDLLHGAGPGSGTADLITALQSIEQEANQPIAFLQIDTVSRAVAGGDENSSVDMGTFIRHVERIQQACGAHVMMVHHAGKDMARGARGWSGIRAAVDTELEIHEGTITVTKQRDIDEIAPIAFSLKEIELGKNSEGEMVTSCVVRLGPEAEFEIPDTPIQENALEHILKLAETYRMRNRAENVTLSRQEIARVLIAAGIDENSIGPTITRLAETGAIRKPKNGQRGLWIVKIPTKKI